MKSFNQKLKEYLVKNITQYASKMKLWEGTDLFELLSKDKQVRGRGRSTEPFYKWPWAGKAHINMYSRHRKMGMPFHFIPSCSRFIAILSPYDWILGIFGRAIRGKGSTVDIRNWRSGSANKFLFSMFLQLGRHRDKGEGKKYWECGWRLMNSHAYQVSAFNYVLHNWHREMSVKQVNKIMMQVKELVQNQRTNIDFKRVYILKANGKQRPLGVPTKAWRVYLHMLNNLIVWHRIGKEGSQHAYFPGRGVHTAWSEIFERIDSPNIYEFDLKGFFDNVDMGWISERLRKQGLPVSAIYFIQDLCKSIPKMPKELPMDETTVRVKIAMNEAVKGKYNPDLRLSTSFKEFEELGEYGWELIRDWLKSEGYPANAVELGLIEKDLIVMKILEWNWALMDSLGMYKRETLEKKPQVSMEALGEYFKGVPQGAATSCGLATMALSHLTDEGSLWKEYQIGGVTIVMYADDGIIFLERSEELEVIKGLFEEAGVELSEEKSRWIKKEGKWQTDLKFCGIIYSGKDQTIKASTREGATLQFGIKDQFLAYLLEKREQILLGGSAGHLNSLKSYKGISIKSWVLSELTEFLSVVHPQSQLFKGRWSGYFLSSLYNNSWDVSRPQNVELFCLEKNSWVRMIWPTYRKESLNQLWKPLLESKLKDIIHRIDAAPKNPITSWYHNLEGLTVKGSGLPKDFSWNELVKDSGELGNKKTKPKDSLKNLKDKIKELTEGNKKLGMLTKELQLVSQALDYFQKRESGDKCKANISEGKQRKLGEMLGGCLEINVYNASTFACDSLLRDWPFNCARHGYVIEGINQRDLGSEILDSDLRDHCWVEPRDKILGPKTESKPGPRYHFYYPKDQEGKVISREEKVISWHENLSKLWKKLTRKISKEFKRNFGVKPKYQ